MTFAVPFVFAQEGADKDVAHTAPASETYVPTLTFDVASIRQSPEADSYIVGGYFSPHSSSFRATNVGVTDLIADAYGIREDQIAGMPDWHHAIFNVQAKSDDTADERLAKLGKDQEKLERQHMMQALLADRFNLKTHWDTREGLTYNLVVSKSGPKMSTAKGAPPTPEQIKTWGSNPIPHLYQRGDSRIGLDFIATACSMKDVTDMLAGQFGHPVADKTGLTGKYDFILRYHGTRQSDRNADDMDTLPTLDVAIQDQLGLKLEPAKGSIQFLIIDHIEKPSEN